MSYLTQARIAADNTIRQRVIACAAMERIESPDGWAISHAWELSARPDWVAAYAESGASDPGGDEDAITDDMIRAAVLAISTPPETPSV